jgi:hypothetical protein
MVEFMVTQTENKKLESLIHYIIWRCQDPTTLGATKLNKVLWHSDVFAYIEHGKSITGVSYVKQVYGPIPNPKDFLLARGNLQESGKIAITKDLYYTREQTQFVALQRPDISEFSPEEISIVDIIIDEICNKHTAKDISMATHDIIWEAAEIGEEIPLYAVFAARFGNITEEDIQWGRYHAKRLGMIK